MAKFTLNSRSTGNFRTEVINGREHIVTQMVSVVGDSVMNNLLYPLDEITKSHLELNNLHAPAGHPRLNGQNVSAFHPMAVNSSNIGGVVLNPRMEGNAVINDLAFDVNIAANDSRGQEAIRRIKAGESIGVSTGLNADVIQTPGTIEGKAFNGSVTNIKWDHVAILLDDTPAGDSTFTINSDTEELIVANVASNVFKKPLEESNITTNEEGKDMDKEAFVLALITNANNSYTMADRDSLMSMPESTLATALSNHTTTIEDATKVITDAGFKVNQVDEDAYKEFTTNKTAYDAFMAGVATARKEKITKLVANSKMTEDQLTNMDDATIDSFIESLGATADFSLQGQQTTHSNASTGGANIQLVEGF